MVSAIIASAWVGSGSAIAALSTPRGESRAAWITLGAVLGSAGCAHTLGRTA